MPHVNGDMKPAHRVPRPVQRGTLAHPLRYDERGQPKAVAQRLRPMAIALSFFGSIAQSMCSTAASETVRVKDVARELFHFSWFRGIGSLLPLMT